MPEAIKEFASDEQCRAFFGTHPEAAHGDSLAKLGFDGGKINSQQKIGNYTVTHLTTKYGYSLHIVTDANNNDVTSQIDKLPKDVQTAFSGGNPLSKYKSSEAIMTTSKSGARNSTADAAKLRKILALVNDLLGGEIAEGEGKSAALKLMAMPGMNPEDAEMYARQEMGDIMTACSALCSMASMTNEAGEPDDIVKVASIMRGIINFISGEIDEMEAAGKLGDADGEVGEGASPTERIIKQAPAFIPNLKLSYAKSMSIFGTDEEMSKKLAVKFVGRDEIQSYTNMWGSAGLTDIEQEYFTKDTNFWDDILGKSVRPLTWDHAQDADFKAIPLIGQIVEMGDDEIGRWYVAKLDRSHRYRKAIDQLIKEGKLGTSSDSAPQYVERVKTGKATWLKTWPLFAAALTDAPCEPRMIGSIEYAKSLGIELPEMAQGASWDWNRNRLLLAKSKLSI